MPLPLTEALRDWHDFYALIGTAAATLVGLMFVVASIGAGVFTSAHQAGTRSFLSPTVVHFSAVLLICLLAVAPAETWLSLGTLLSVASLIGSAYSGWIWRRMTKHGFWVTIDMADRLWYTILPVAAYVVVGGAGLSLLQHKEGSLNVLAMSVIALLIIGIRNAWDMTVWTMHRHQN
jgi:hypothetical protein